MLPSRSLDGIRLAPRPAPIAPAPVSKIKAKPDIPSGKRRIRTPYRAILLYSVVGAYLYLVASPILPRFTMAQIARTSGPLAPAPTTAVLGSVSTTVNLATAPAPSATPIPGPNNLTLPSAGVNGQIYEGAGESTLNKGIWHIPGTSTPDKGGNTVLAAHRFMFLTGGNTFYNLDKVKDGDQFTIVWSGKLYTYQVYDIKVVTSTTVSIEDNTDDPIVTLFTCTPLWTSKDRLVVRGRLVTNGTN